METTSQQLNALRGMINIGVERAAGVLNTLGTSGISLMVEDVQCLTQEQLPQELGIAGENLWLVMMPFNGPLEGDAGVIFSGQDGAQLVSLLTGKGKEHPAIDTLEAGTLSEIGNIVLNGVMTTVSNGLGLSLIYQVPSVHEVARNRVQPLCNQRPFTVLLAHARFSVADLEAAADIVLFFEERSFGVLAETADTFVVKGV